MRYAIENGIDGKKSDRSERQKDPCCETVSHLRCVHGADHDGRNAGIGFGGMAAGRWRVWSPAFSAVLIPDLYIWDLDLKTSVFVVL